MNRVLFTFTFPAMDMVAMVPCLHNCNPNINIVLMFMTQRESRLIFYYPLLSSVYRTANSIVIDAYSPVYYLYEQWSTLIEIAHTLVSIHQRFLSLPIFVSISPVICSYRDSVSGSLDIRVKRRMKHSFRKCTKKVGLQRSIA